MVQWFIDNNGLVIQYTFTLIIAIAIAVLCYWLVVRVIRKGTSSTHNQLIYKSMKINCARPFLVLFLAVFVLLAFKIQISPHLHISTSETIRQIISIIIMLTFGWLMAGIVDTIEDFLTGRYDVNARDNLKARKVHTQIRIMKKIAYVIIFILTFSCVIMTFEKARQFGTSLLASAGIIGIVIGLAAQKSISTLIAGLQIAITQPIRIDDVVIVDGEWGNIEDITMTYVVVRIWDKRRLIVPITNFIEKTFQNWTRVSADLIGTIFIYVDYNVPLEKIREYFLSIIPSQPQWDNKVACMQVTNCGEKTVELRFLASAADASLAWDLRCDLREKLLVHIRDSYPGSLPKMRADVTDKV